MPVISRQSSEANSLIVRLAILLLKARGKNQLAHCEVTGKYRIDEAVMLEHRIH